LARTVHKLQRADWGLLRTSVLVTMAHVSEGLARHCLRASDADAPAAFGSEASLASRVVRCWRGYSTWVGGVVGLLGDLEVGP
jgi:hypothetical protein